MDNTPSEDRLGFKRYKGLFIAILAAVAIFFLLLKFDTVRDTVNKYLGYVAPVIYGICIAYILSPVANFFEAHLKTLMLKSKSEKVRNAADKRARTLSIAVAIILGIAAVVILCLMIIPSLLESVIELGNRIIPLIDELAAKLDGLTKAGTTLGETLQTIVDGLTDTLKVWIKTNMIPTAETILSYITSGVASVVVVLYNFLIGIVVAVYALAERRKFVSGAKKIVYVTFKPHTSNRIIDTARHGHEIFGGFLTGKLIDSLIVGLICFAFCICTSMPYSMLISTIVGITNIVPFFGPFIGGIPSTLIILMVDPIKGVIFGIFIIILQQIDGNIIGAKILGNTTGISEFWVTFSLLLFGGMFGFIGMMIGVPLFSVIYYLITALVNDRAQRRSLSTDDDFYYNVDRYDEERGEFIMHTPEKLGSRKKHGDDGMLTRVKKKIAKNKDKKK